MADPAPKQSFLALCNEYKGRVLAGTAAVVLIGGGIVYSKMDSIADSFGYGPKTGPNIELVDEDLSCRLPENTLRVDGKSDHIVASDGNGNLTSLRRVEYWKVESDNEYCDPNLGTERIISP